MRLCRFDSGNSTCSSESGSVPCPQSTWQISLSCQSPTFEVRVHVWICSEPCTDCTRSCSRWLILALPAGDISNRVLIDVRIFLFFRQVANSFLLLLMARTMLHAQLTPQWSEPPMHDVPHWLRGPWGLLPSRYWVSKPGVDYSYRAHLDFLPDSAWCDYGYDPQGCLSLLEMDDEGCVACTATLESKISMLTAQPPGLRARSW